MERVCGSCRQMHGRVGQSYCRRCHALYMRQWRPKHSELTDEQRKRANARSYANVYQRRGLLHPKPCEQCGAARVQKHHGDYDKPLDVAWLCRRCHRMLHAHPVELAC